MTPISQVDPDRLGAIITLSSPSSALGAKDGLLAPFVLRKSAMSGSRNQMRIKNSLGSLVYGPDSPGRNGG